MFASVAAAAPVQVALVENVIGNPPGVEFMDYLDIGKIIALGPRDTIVISYLSSCMRETITAANVTVGSEQSEVQSGRVTRSKVQCDAGKMLLPSDRTSEFAGRAFRGASVTEPVPQLTLYGSSPMLEVKAPGTLVVERIDQSTERYAVDVGKQHLMHGTFYDFARWGRTLAAGGTYKVSLGGDKIVFKVDPAAQTGNTPIVGRILRFEVIE
jgi:hypothetical protein